MPRPPIEQITGDELLESMVDLFEQGLIQVAEPIGDEPGELPRIEVTPLGRAVARMAVLGSAGGGR